MPDTRPVNQPDWQIRPWQENVQVEELPVDCVCTWSYYKYVSKPGGIWRLKFRYALCRGKIHKKDQDHNEAS